MPYIDKEKRKLYDTHIKAIAEALKQDPDNFEGNLNYIFSKMILLFGPKKYKQWNGCIGALESCKIELYRRFIALYEDTKIKDNGDII